MPAKKTQKQKKKHRKKSLTDVSPIKETITTEKTDKETITKNILSGLILVYFLGYFYNLFSFMDTTVFWADEIVHAYISSVISKTHQLPFVLPEEIYGGFEWSYPPLFHILSALIMSIVGPGALKFINLSILLIFFISFYILIRKYSGYNEAVIACLLLSVSPVIAINTIRFMTELLSMFMIFFSFFFLLLALTKQHMKFAIISGMATGFLLLSKQVGIIVISYYGLLLLWFLIKKDKNARTMFYVLGISMCVYIPYLVLAIYHDAEIFGFLSLFVGNKPDWATEAVRSFRRFDSSVQEFAYLFISGNEYVITLSLILPIYFFIKTRQNPSPPLFVFIMLIYISGAMMIWHITNSRHTIILLPLIAFLVGFCLHQIAGKKKMLMAAITFLLLIYAGYMVYVTPNYRQIFNAPQEFMDTAQIIQADSDSAGRTLSIDPFGVIYHAGKPAIWPFANLRKIPIDLVENTDAENLYKLLKRYNIKYVLIDRRYAYQGNDFNGRNYPQHLYVNCQLLKLEGKIQLIYLSKSQRLLLLKVI